MSNVINALGFVATLTATAGSIALIIAIVFGVFQFFGD